MRGVLTSSATHVPSVLLRWYMVTACGMLKYQLEKSKRLLSAWPCIVGAGTPSRRSCHEPKVSTRLA
eukprot:149074-Prymnesium_polylepis.1